MQKRHACVVCGKPGAVNYHKNGRIYWRKVCKRHKKMSERPYVYRKKKKPHCEKCGFVALHRGQLDVDHIDGNHDNHAETNLQTLCSNCHRLKTWAPALF